MADSKKLSSDVEVTTSSPDDARVRKVWGYVSAYPHEYLIHFRGGRLSERTSGQGARCYKWPADTVFIIPTSLKEIVFQANQLSADNVDVRIRGMAIYRISNPMRIYTMLNFSDRQRAEEKLARMIGDLCRSNAKWLVANMNVDECMRKRKEDIAESLRQEVSLVVADPETGWGVEIVTVDIQDVYIQDDEIFEAMQTEFKAEKLRESQLSQLEMEKDLDVRRLAQERELAEHRRDNELEKAHIQAEIKNEEMGIQKDLQVRELQQERELAEHRRDNELEKARIEATIQGEKTKLAQENDEAQFALDRYRVEQNAEIDKYKLEQELERDRQRIQLQAEEKQAELEAERLAHEVAIEALRQRMDVENSATPLSLEKNFIETALPAIAEAMARSMSNSRINVIQGDGEGGTPFRFVLMEVLDILRDRMEGLEKTE
jgi:regulator of protease activity HflC (stomatin/prohibitin superfamily)